MLQWDGESNGGDRFGDSIKGRVNMRWMED